MNASLNVPREAPSRNPRAPPLRADFPVLCLLELCVSLDKLLGSATGKAHGDAAIPVVSFDTDASSYAITGVSDPPAQHRMGVATTLCGRVPKRAWACLSPGPRSRLLGFSTHAAEKLFRGIRVLRIGFVA